MIYETNAYCGSVKTGKSRSEQLFSDLPPEADLTADIVDVSQVQPKADACSAGRVEVYRHASHAHLLQLKDEHLIRERETAAAQRATRNIGRRTVGRSTDRLPPTRQFR
jgi:hypothetical protein